jgi:hypothetical protein
MSLKAWPYHLIFLITVTALIKIKHFRFRNVLLFLVSTGLFLYGMRAQTFWLICCIYIILDACGDLKIAEKWHKSPTCFRTEIFLALMIAVLMGAHSYRLYHQKAFLQGKIQRVKFLKFDPFNPHVSLSQLDKLNIRGTVFNWDAYGGYMIWESYPRLRPFTDGRQANPGLYKKYLQVTQKPHQFWPEIEKQFQVRVALLNGGNYTNHRLLDYLIVRPDWQLISVRGNAVILVKREAFNLTANILNFENNIKKLSQFRLKFDPVNIKPLQEDTLIYNEDLKEGSIFFGSGFPEHGLRLMKQSYKITGSRRAAERFNQALSIYNQP